MTSQATISLHVAFLVTWKDDPIDRGLDGNFVFHFRFLILPFACIFTLLFIHILLSLYHVHMCHVYTVRCINTNKTYSLSLWHSQFLFYFSITILSTFQSPYTSSPQQSPHWCPCLWVPLPLCSIHPPSNLWGTRFPQITFSITYLYSHSMLL